MCSGIVGRSMKQETAIDTANHADTRELTVGSLNVVVSSDGEALSGLAAELFARTVESALSEKNHAAAILATGQSQIRFYEKLIARSDVDWERLTLFHMDEYLGLPGDHPSSFRHYLRERVESQVPCREFHYLVGDAAEPATECDRYAALLQAQPIDVCVLGVGNNGHLAFNDPPVARFDDPFPVKIVKLDEVCRQQQVNQGHFPGIDAMPAYALTLSIPTLCSARRLLCLAPGEHKAEIVQTMLTGPISPECPASILRQMPQATLLLEEASARLI